MYIVFSIRFLVRENIYKQNSMFHVIFGMSYDQMCVPVVVILNLAVKNVHKGDKVA